MLTHQTYYSKEHVIAVVDSNHQLLSTGRNLNQIAHALNIATGQSTDNEEIQLVEELVKAIRRHVNKVGESLSQTHGRRKLFLYE